MPTPIDVYRHGYERGRSDSAGGRLAEITMGMLRDDPGGHFQKGYGDGAAGRPFNPPSIPAPSRLRTSGLIPKFSENPFGWFFGVLIVVELWVLWQLIKAPFQLVGSLMRSEKPSPWVIIKNVIVGGLAIALVWWVPRANEMHGVPASREVGAQSSPTLSPMKAPAPPSPAPLPAGPSIERTSTGHLVLFGNVGDWRSYWQKYGEGSPISSRDDDALVEDASGILRIRSNFAFESKQMFSNNVDVTFELKDVGEGHTEVGFVRLISNTEAINAILTLNTFPSEHRQLLEIYSYSLGSGRLGGSETIDPYQDKWLSIRMNVAGEQVSVFVDGQFKRAVTLPLNQYRLHLAGYKAGTASTHETDVRSIEVVRN